MTEGNKYADEYIERCFQVWYSSNQPSMALLQRSIPESPDGRIPATITLSQFRDEHGWDERADGLTALAVKENDKLLINNKAEMLREMAQDAHEMRTTAKAHILENGFDNSSSAVTAYFKASEEERLVRGVSEMLLKVSNMASENLLLRANKLLKRKNEAVDGEIVEDSDADGSSPAPE